MGMCPHFRPLFKHDQTVHTDQVLGVSVDFNDANIAWAEKLGPTYPLLSDMRRQASKAYGVLFDDPTLIASPKTIPRYLQSKRSWFVIDKEGVVRYAHVDTTRTLVPNDDILQVLRTLS
jgi:glutaredoxin-dependent peroxiredoxin